MKKFNRLSILHGSYNIQQLLVREYSTKRFTWCDESVVFEISMFETLLIIKRTKTRSIQLTNREVILYIYTMEINVFIKVIILYTA